MEDDKRFKMGMYFYFIANIIVVHWELKLI